MSGSGSAAFPGLCAASALTVLGLPPAGFTPAGFEYYGQISFLKAGLVYADALTTVSPTYAVELQSPAFGMGFEGVLQARRADLVGILNGVDDEVWNPGTDPFIKAPYGPDAPEGKPVNRAALQDTMGLDPDPAALLFCVVSSRCSARARRISKPCSGRPPRAIAAGSG